MKQHQLAALLYLLLGIECGSGFVGRGWARNAPSFTTAKQRGLVRRQQDDGQERSINNAKVLIHSRSLHRAQKKDNASGDDSNDVKDTSRRKNERNIFADLLNRTRKDEDTSRATNSKKKPDKRRKKIKLQEGSARASSSFTNWFRRFLPDGKNEPDSLKKAPSILSSTTTAPPPRKDRITQPLKAPPPPQKSSTTPAKPSTTAITSGLNKSGQAPIGSTASSSSRKAVAAKQKALEEKNKSPPSFNPLLYLQTAFKNTAAVSLSFFDNSDNTNKDEWVTVFQTSGIMPGESVPITVRGLDLLVIASLDGRSLYCIANSCPHLGTPLETGILTRLPMEEPTTTSSTSSAAFPGPDVFGGSLQDKVGLILSETQVSEILSQDGCEDCIICPLHRTAFALRSGAVRGDWCPHPPVLGPALGLIKAPTAATTYEIRTRAKNVQVKLLATTTTKPPSNTVSSSSPTPRP